MSLVVNEWGKKVKLTAKMTGGSAIKTPEKKPNRTAMMTIPATLSTAIRQKQRILQARAPGPMRLREPVLSEIALGTVLPKTEAALRMGTR